MRHIRVWHSGGPGVWRWVWHALFWQVRFPLGEIHRFRQLFLKSRQNCRANLYRRV
uniref:Uncharacterized protein n=1 Tax=Anguilla anguilla TaxID=7936 RepID=A0A0E9RJC2_ANGAN